MKAATILCTVPWTCAGWSKRAWVLFFWTVLIPFIPLCAQQQHSADDHYGLSFNSFEVDPVERSSLDISSVLDKPIDTLEFDLAMNGFSSFGYIFRSLTVSGTKIDFLYTPNEGGHFKLIVDGKETEIDLEIKQTEVRRNFWRTIEMTFSDKEITLKSGGLSFEHDLTRSGGISKLIFGVNDLPELQTVDCPSFTIRDLKISYEGSYQHHWSADESEGNTLQDVIGRHTLTAINAQWRAEQSFHWKAIGEMRGIMSLIVSHDPIRERILWVQPESIQSFDLTNGFASQFELSSEIESRFGHFDTTNDQLITYDMEPVGVTQIQIDTSARIIVEMKNPKTPVQNLWLTASFINPLDSHLMLLGGYGFFTSKNSLWSYNLTTKQWKLAPLKGDTLAPRYHHAMATGPNPGQFYVFGGIGNFSGKQELGLQHYYDLHLLDLNDHSLKKLWELTDVESQFSVVNQMVYSEEDQSLYVLGYRAFGEVNNLALMKLEVNQPSLQVVGDSIPFIQKGFDRTQAGLFHSEKSGELIAYTLVGEGQQANLKLHSILFPPKLLSAKAPPSIFNPEWYWFVILLTMFLVVAIARRKKAMNSGLRHIQPIPEPIKNTIRLWGGFTVFDNHGENISDQFSPKIKELFLLLFFNSIGEGQGIKAQKIYEKVWPGLERVKAKNALGVTMGRLRSALQEIESVQVINKSGDWKLQWKSEVATDYHLTILSLDQLQKGFSEEVLERLITVVERGPFLPNSEIEWLDDLKGKVNFRVTNSLMEISERVLESERRIKIANIILSIDDLHEQAVRIKIGALTKLGKHGLANDCYEEFAKKYEELYQEAFPQSFKEMMD